MAKEDGGPAFPQVYRVGGCSTQVNAKGLTLRDWFAGQALASVAADILQGGANKDADPAYMLASTAGYCYGLADAMLAERAKQ